MTSDARDLFNLKHPKRGHLPPLRDRLGSDVQVLAEGNGTACGLDSSLQGCCAHGSEYKHDLHSTASDTFIAATKVQLTVTSMGGSLGTTLKAARKAKQLTLKEVAAQLNVSYPAVQQWESGRTTPSRSNLLRVCQLLGMEFQEVVRLLEDDTLRMDMIPRPDLPAPRLEASTPPSVADPQPAERTDFSGPRDVPEWGIAVGGKDDDGDFHFNGQTVDYAPRPPGIAKRKGIFTIRVVNDSMVPRFDEGDRVYIDTNRPPAIGDDVVIELKAKAECEVGRGFIKRLVRRTPTKIVVTQFNPAAEIEFDRDEVLNLFRVIPWGELLGI